MRDDVVREVFLGGEIECGEAVNSPISSISCTANSNVETS